MKRGSAVDSPDALRSKAGQALASGDVEGARRFIRRALVQAPARLDIMLALGHVELAAGDREAAASAARKVLKRDPEQIRGWVLLGQALVTDDVAAAREALQQAVQRKPDDLEALFQLGNLEAGQDKLDAAIAHFERASNVAPDNPHVQASLAVHLARAGQTERAAALLRDVVEREPGNLQARAALAQLLFDAYEFAEALPHYRGIVDSVHDAGAAMWNNLGVCERHVGDIAAARNSFSRALERAADAPAVLANLGFVEFELRHLERARALLSQADELQPGRLQVKAQLLEIDLLRADWHDFEERCAAIIAAVAAGTPAARQTLNPFSFLSICDDPRLQLEAARSFAWPSQIGAQGLRLSRGPSEPMRLGFVFISLDERPETRLVVGLLEKIDRRRFDIAVYGLQRCVAQGMRDRIAGVASNVVEFGPASTQSIVARLRGDRLEVVLDVAGYTGRSRPDVFASRVAALQVNFVAYAGTLGATHYDCVISDSFTTPPAQQQSFVEELLNLPGCYLPSDPHRAIAPALARGDYGLPARGFVFAAPASSSKIIPPMFDAWMRLLACTDASVLWLRPMADGALRALRAEASRRNVDPDRLVFAPGEAVERYLGRMQLADLFLDTFPFGSHTTLNDALFAGLPAITLAGRSMAARASASQLHACGLDELIATSLEGYEALALSLVADAGKLAAIRQRLADRSKLALFDMQAYARAFEAVLTRRVAAHRNG